MICCLSHSSRRVATGVSQAMCELVEEKCYLFPYVNKFTLLLLYITLERQSTDTPIIRSGAGRNVVDLKMMNILLG